MNVESILAIPGLLELAVVCLTAMLAALGIALVSGCGGAALMFFWLTKVRKRTSERLETTRMWEELARPGAQDRENL